MKTKNPKCPYCGSTAVLRKASYVYGDNALEEYLYVCPHYPECNAYVGVHKGTRIPKGTLADGDLRSKRIQAHKAFSQLWTSGIMSKKQAYRWMQYKFCLSPELAHIGHFSEYRCDELIKASCEVLQNNRVSSENYQNRMVGIL